MPVFALYNFDDAGSSAQDSALGNGAQNGLYINGAVAAAGNAVLDGDNDFVKIYPDAAFQLDRGTLDISFTLGSDPLTGTQTILSRDSAGTTDGGYRIEILADGAVVISHETPTGTETFGAPAGFAAPGDSITLSYSWDQGGTGGRLIINNVTTGETFSEAVPNTLTMDMSGQGINQPWIIGAGQSTSTPDQLNNIDQHFEGTVSMFQLSDTVDNLSGAPDANPDTATTTEDTPVTIPVLANDTDPTGQPLTVTTATAPNGTVVVNPDGTLTYTPNDDYTGPDTITYVVTDPDGNTSTSTVAVSVTPVNDAPEANPDTSVTAPVTPVTFAVLGNDTDVDGDTLSILGTPTSPNGTVVVNADGTLTFTPAAGFTGEAVVNYTIVDEEGLTDATTWTITVTEPGSPDANPDTAATAEDSPVTIPVLANDTDPTGQPLTVTSATAPNGTVTINPDGTVTYLPNPEFNGPDTITYTVTDPDGNTATSTVAVNVIPLNDAPEANPDTSVTGLDTPVTFAVLGNDTDVDGDTLSITGTPTSANGTVVVNADGTLTFTPTAGFIGEAVVNYTIIDEEGLTDTTTWTITVTDTGTNDAPEANPDTSVTAPVTPVTFAVLGNDTDVDGDTLSILGTPTSPNGTVVVNVDGTLTFTPAAGFTGEAVVNYTIVDEEGLTDTSTWTITVTPPGTPDGVVRGTTGGDLINADYVDPTDTDRVDANDALLPGEVGNDDIIEAGAGNDTVLAGLGNDDVRAGTGDDSVNGGDGEDSVLGGLGNDSIFGDAGNDTLLGNEGNDEIVGGLGNDSILGGANDDALQGNDGNDTLLGENGNDTLNGGVGNDLLVSGAEGSPDRTYPGLYVADTTPNDDRDSVVGGFGNDTIRTGDDADTIIAGIGNDLVDAGNDDDLVNGGLDDDTLIGGEGNDTVNGDAGNDLVYGGTIGNTGPTDLIDADDLDDNNNRDSLLGAEGDDSLYGGDDADTMDGGVGNDVLDGGIDDDSITAGEGNDLVLGAEGDDTIDGGAGDDTIRGDGPTVVDSNDRAYPGLYPADSLPGNNRDFITAGLGNDQVFGGDDADTLFGDGGNDTIYAGIDADSVVGGEGNDTLVGEEGSDTMDGGVGNDLLVGGTYNPAAADPFAQPNPLNLPDASDLDTGNDRDSLSGGFGNDTIYGGDDDDTLAGGDSDDLVYGGIDEDSITGGAGNDTLFGDEGDDTVDGGAGNDLLQNGAGNDSLVGGADRDTIIGANAGDRVDGSEAGDDTDVLDLRGLGPISIAYDPTNIENGTVTFLDAAGNPTGTMEFVNIENVLSDAPDANPDVATTPEDTPVTFPVLGNDTDPNGDPLTIVGVPTATNGTVVVNPDGTLTYTPDPDYNGPDTITYTVTDPDGNTSTTTVAVTVTPVNDAPDAVDDETETPYQTPITFAVTGNDTDPDGDDLTVTSVGTSPDGTVTLNPDGTITFAPAPGFYGETTFTYTVTDEEGLTDTATVTVTVVEPDRDGIVTGTTGGDLIDTAYIDPTDGDRVDRNDAIIPGDAPNDDRVEAGAGNDTVLAGLGDDTVNAGEGNDSVVGGAGDDVLNGEEGNDTLTGGNGNDTVDGGDGDDLVDTTGGSNGSTPLPDIDYPGVYPADSNPTNDLDSVIGGAGNDTIRTGDDADTIEGGAGNDLIDAGIDADLVTAGSGNDTVVGSEGADTIDGGLGNDLIYGGLNDVIGDTLDLPDAEDLRPDNNRDSLTGGAGDDTIFGRDDDDTIDGGAGNDLIDGGIDEDSILGGTGNDTITGSQGADTATGGDDRDVFIIPTQIAGIGDVIDGSEGGDDNDTLDLRGAGDLRIVYDPTNRENGTVTFLDADRNPTGTLTFTNIENVIPCFTPGTLIATPKGEVPVEFLKAGDRVITRDNGIQEIRWTGQKQLGWKDLAANPHLKPVLIRQGSLGNGLPERDMLVSPNHRMLVANDRTALYFDEHEVLVSAKHLVSGAGIQTIDSVGTTYIHFMFDRHEVVLGNGAWTESFQPGDQTLGGMGNAQRSEIFELFPELKTEEGVNDYQAARRTLKKHEAKLLIK
jgi:Ca2+-binding RTX toxin-like protein